MDRTFPRWFFRTQYGPTYDTEITAYGSGAFTATNQFLRGGVGTGFSFARDISLVGRTTSAYPLQVPVLTDLWEFPENFGHGVNTALDKPPVIMIDTVGITVSNVLTVAGAGIDALATVNLEVGLAIPSDVVYPMCRMTVGMGLREVTGSVDLTTLSYPVSAMTGSQLWVGLDGIDPVPVNFLVGDVGSAAAIVARIQATLDASFGVLTAQVGLTTSNHLYIRSLGTGASAGVLVAFGSPAAMAKLGFREGQQSRPVTRAFTNNAGNAVFGSAAADKNMALNEGWDQNYLEGWAAGDGASKKLFLSPPLVSGADRLVLKNYNLSTPGGNAITVGHVTVWLSGAILPAY